MAELWAQYESWSTGVGQDIVAWTSVGWTPTVGSVASQPLKDWPLCSFPVALAITIGYLLFVFVGSYVMRSMPAVSDKFWYGPKFVYNLVQVFLCAYMAIEAMMLKSRLGYTFLPISKPNPFNATNPPVANLLWLFYLSKGLDFFDTVTIVTQKRFKQLSFLHVYHHASVFLFYWLNTQVGYDGDIYLTVFLNAFIHTIMYTYYFLSMHTKDIWWKKYLTMFQMVQFCIMITQGCLLLQSGTNEWPPRNTQVYVAYICSMLFLFSQFFVQSYLTKKPRAKKE